MTAQHYEFLAPRRLVVGWGRRRELGTLAAGLGDRAWIVWGSRRLEEAGFLEETFDALSASGLTSHVAARIHREPTVDDVDRAATAVRREAIPGEDVVVAIGGGAAIDLGKAIAGIAAQRSGHSACDYLEGVGRESRLEATPLPVIAVPTTAGTGSEATKNAVISGETSSASGGETRPFKKSLRDPRLLPEIALVDPQFATHAPHSVTVHSGLDALTQCIESFVSHRATPMTRPLALAGIPPAISALPKLIREPDHQPSREAMANAALFSGMALANSGLGIAHGVAAALGVRIGVPHGLACAAMLPIALRANRAACTRSMAQMERAVLPSSAKKSAEAAADSFVDRIARLVGDLGVPTQLRELGLDGEAIPEVAAAAHGNSRSGNPREISDNELIALLEEAW